jgi:hypothetical protein
MTFLPIIERELRLAARKRSTFWLRIIAALVATMIGSGLMIISLAGGMGRTMLGSALFGILTWLALGAALAAGLFFTSDCLSEEKREGTLGFLFLTDLRGYDVAGGKLLATSLRGSFALLAIFPILAATLLMGGVTGAQFWKTTLALVNALFCSLALGVFVSAISRDPQKAMAGTLFLLLVWLAAGPLADAILSAVKWGGRKTFYSLSSPFYVFGTCGAWGRTFFWRGLLVSHAIAWLLFALASLLVPRTWQERHAAAAPASSSSWSYAWRYGGARRRQRLRRRLIGRNAVLWLACRERWQSLGAWAMAFVVTAAFSGLLIGGNYVTPECWIVWNSFGWAFTWLLYLWAASQACRFFVEARRSGLIELLMAAPVRVRDIVDGQWQALLRLFGLPLILLLAVQLTGSYFAATRSMGLVPAQARGMIPTVAITLAGSGAAIIVVAANLVAICWFGMWMGMTSRTNNLATLKTLLFVQVIPGMAISFASALAIPLVLIPTLLKGGFTSSNLGSALASKLTGWIPLISIAASTALALGKDFGFFVWARRMLYESFREQATRSLSPLRYSAPHLVGPPIPAPPIIQPQQ